MEELERFGFKVYLGFRSSDMGYTTCNNNINGVTRLTRHPVADAILEEGVHSPSIRYSMGLYLHLSEYALHQALYLGIPQFLLLHLEKKRKIKD